MISTEKRGKGDTKNKKQKQKITKSSHDKTRQHAKDSDVWMDGIAQKQRVKGKRVKK